MESFHFPGLIFLIVLTFRNVPAAVSDDARFAELFERIERLEERDAGHLREIAALNEKVTNVERDARERETELLNELETVKATVCKQDDSDSTFKDAGIKNVEQVIEESKQTKRSPIARQVVENEVAFYATHTQHDVRHLAKGAPIAFDQVVSNIGKAYTPTQGTFVAPVNGVYVFHVTMMGLDTHAYSGNHFSAYIDVNGAGYSQLWVTEYDQSSQMFVTELQQGDSVTVKNGHQNEGMVGQHMSTFSGFLLYQRDYSVGVIGK